MKNKGRQKKTKTAEKKCCDSASELLDAAVQEPENFISPPSGWHPSWISSTKQLYDSWMVSGSQEGILPRLEIEDFDDEQIWQQLELASNAKIDQFFTHLSSIVSRADHAVFSVHSADENVESADELVDDAIDTDEEFSEENEADDQNDEQEEEEDSDSGNSEDFESSSKTEKITLKNRIVPSEIDDKFFKLSQVNEYLDIQDKLDEARLNGKGQDEDDGIDYFEEISSDASIPLVLCGEDAKYEDFFDPPPDESNQLTKKKKVHFAESNEPSNFEKNEGSTFTFPADAPDDQPKSGFELEQDQLKKKITMLEEQNVSAKPWQLMGESSATNRPANALLEEFLSYDNVSKQAPVITEVVSKTLEGMIKQRIKDKSWDDVERKAKPVKDPFEYKKQLVLDQEKSKISLAEIYEKEYLKARDASNKDDDPAERPELAEIRKSMDALFRKLDALSNYHFAPRPVEPELKIVSNQPAVTVEEVAPVSVSDAALLAPQEVQDNQRGDLKAVDERSETDKKRERRKKKVFQREKFKRKADREKTALEQSSKSRSLEKLEKQTAMKKIKSGAGGMVSFASKKSEKADKKMKTSTKFFDALQDITRGVAPTKKRAGNDAQAINLKRLKL